MATAPYKNQITLDFKPMNRITFFSIFIFIFTLLSCSSEDNNPDPVATPISVSTQDFSITIDEYPVNGQRIGTVLGSTNDGAITFSLIAENPVGAFVIDSNSGELKVEDANLFKFDTNPVITGMVKVSNGDVFENAMVMISLNEVSYTYKLYDGSIALRTQEALDVFGSHNYTHIKGGLLIGYSDNYRSDIHDLSALRSIKKIEGLTISKNPELKTTSGLNISDITFGVYIMDNAALTTLDGFDNLPLINQGLQITNNPVLADLSSLGQITKVGSLAIGACPAIPNLEWLSNITSINVGITISNCNSLKNMDGLRNWNTTYGGITIMHNELLENIDGLQNLNANVPEIILINNKSLLSINGFQNINVTSRISLVNNYKLQSLRGLEQVTSLPGGVEIDNNNALIDFEGLSNLTSTYGSFSIRNNESLISLNGLNSLSDIWMMSAYKNPQLADFCALQNLLTINPEHHFSATENLYNPTSQDIIDGNCAP